MQERAVAHRERALLRCDDSAVRQIVDRAAMPALGTAVETLAMQHVVHVAGARP